MRYLMTFSYDGTYFYGYQKQPNKRTIQEEIEKVLSQILNKKITIHASGRTDTKVHAINQKAHFDVEKELDINKIKHSLNKMLPDDIYIKEMIEVNCDFHARYDVKYKKYIYKLNTNEYNPIDRNYIYQYNKELNIKAMIEGTKYLIGEHNFKSFTKAIQEEKDYVRNIKEITIENTDGIITFTFIGNGFMRYMVRNLVGTLVAVGENKISPIKIKEILECEDRTKAFKTINPEGLYLSDVYYQ